MLVHLSYSRLREEADRRIHYVFSAARHATRYLMRNNSNNILASRSTPNLRRASSNLSNLQSYQDYVLVPAPQINRPPTPMDEGWTLLGEASQMKCIGFEQGTCNAVWAPLSDPRPAIMPTDVISQFVAEVIRQRLQGYKHCRHFMASPEHDDVGSIALEDSERPVNTLSVISGPERGRPNSLSSDLFPLTPSTSLMLECKSS